MTASGQVCAVVLLATLALTSAQQKLPALNVDVKGTTVGGLSAGGFFAVQMQVAFSDVVNGAAIFAGGPYHCAQGSESVGTTTCMLAVPKPNPQKYISDTHDFFRQRQIADPGNLRNHKVYMFSGTQDFIVSPRVMDALLTYYQGFMPNSSIQYVNDFKATHTMPTDDPSVKTSCTTPLPPFIANCHYDGAGIAFKKLYGTLRPRNNGTLQGQLIRFDQAEFLHNPRQWSLDTTGFAYIPKPCKDGQRCKLHVSFHGCTQQASAIGEVYAQKAGFNKWADTNNIVVLYPQVYGSNGCFDWFAYNEREYDWKQGTQMSTVYKMIQRIGSGIKPE